MVTSAGSAGGREAGGGGGGGNRFERTPAEAILYDRWAEELRKGTTARSNLTTSAPRKEMSPSNASIVRVRDMVCIDASVGDPKIQPRHCHGGVGYVVEGGRCRLGDRRRCEA